MKKILFLSICLLVTTFAWSKNVDANTSNLYYGMSALEFKQIWGDAYNYVQNSPNTVSASYKVREEDGKNSYYH